MRLRLLELKDKLFMLEWMHDVSVVEKLNTDFSKKTLDDCERFIRASWKSIYKDLHLAVVDEEDIYQGTVSLKHIDLEASVAEFAITVRRCAMGKGFSGFAMNAILEFGREKLGLNKIYWCVNTDNIRAIRFYDKNGYQRTERVPDTILSQYQDQQGLLWYVWEA